MHTLYGDELAAQYPHLAAAFATIPRGEAHLRRLQDLNASWQGQLMSGEARQYAEVIVAQERAALPAVDTFDIIYAGGGLNLLNAAVMTQRYGLRVLVFDRFTVGAVHREWNISRDELQELLGVGLLSASELASVIQREYREGVVRFHAAHIRVPATELRLSGVLDVAVDAEKLTALCVQKILGQRRAGAPNLVLHDTTFVRCAVQPSSPVTVDVSNAEGVTHSYAGRLLIDGMGSTSPIACQLNCGRPFSLVCPTVGTVARGYLTGSAPEALDPEVGEVLVTTEDARNGRQLIWEAFPGAGDQVAIYLFHYAEAGDRVDLLELFERFFEQLPHYKETRGVEVIKPVYGFIPAGYNVSLPGSRRRSKVLAYERILSLGDAAAFQSPLTFCGFGSYVRNLRRITTLLDQALRTECLQADALKLIQASEAAPAVARAFSKFMIAKDAQREAAWQVNETLNVFCRVLQGLGPGVTNAFFKDRIGWRDYTRLILATPFYYARIYRLAFSTLSPAEGIGWISAWLRLGRQSAAYTFYHALRPVLPGGLIRPLQGVYPRLSLRLAAWREALEQVERGSASAEHRRRRAAVRPASRHWSSRFWPQG
jgi:lycopene cyclase CruA